MHLSEFDYELPKKLIAQEPLSDRDASRLLTVNRTTAETLLEFESGVGLPRSENPNGFGAGWWGTGGATGGTILARATVRSGVSPMSLDFTCVIHGTSSPNSGPMRGQLVVS